MFEKLKCVLGHNYAYQLKDIDLNLIIEDKDGWKNLIAVFEDRVEERCLRCGKVTI